MSIARFMGSLHVLEILVDPELFHRHVSLPGLPVASISGMSASVDAELFMCKLDPFKVCTGTSTIMYIDIIEIRS